MVSIGSIIAGPIVVDPVGYMSKVLMHIHHLLWQVILLGSSSMYLSMDLLLSSKDNLVFVECIGCLDLKLIPMDMLSIDNIDWHQVVIIPRHYSLELVNKLHSRIMVNFLTLILMGNWYTSLCFGRTVMCMCITAY